MTARSLEQKFGTVALEKGFITEDQLTSALDTQMKDTLRQRKHRVIGTILFDQGYINVQQIDEVLGVMKESLS